MPAVEPHCDGRKLVSYPFGEEWFVGDKKGAICTQWRKEVLHLLLRQAESEFRVEEFQHVGRVAAAATQTGPDGNVLPKHHVQWRDGIELSQLTYHAHHQIIFSRPIHGHALELQRVVLRRSYLQRVGQRYGIENCFYVVISILAALHDIEAEVDFAIGAYFHLVFLSWKNHFRGQRYVKTSEVQRETRLLFHDSGRRHGKYDVWHEKYDVWFWSLRRVVFIKTTCGFQDAKRRNEGCKMKKHYF